MRNCAMSTASQSYIFHSALFEIVSLVITLLSGIKEMHFFCLMWKMKLSNKTWLCDAVKPNPILGKIKRLFN